MIKKICAPISGVMRKFGRIKKIFKFRTSSDNYVTKTTDGYFILEKR